MALNLLHVVASLAAAAAAAASPATASSLPQLGSVVTLANTGAGLTLRHCDWQAFATPFDANTSDDFHFILVTGLNGAVGAVSLESVNYPGYYLTPGALGAESARILATQGPTADDASYSAVPGLGNTSQVSFLSLSKNASYAGLYVTQVSTLTGGCASRYGSPSGDIILAAQGAEGALTQTWDVQSLPPVVVSINTGTVDHIVPSRFLGCHTDPGYVQGPLSFTSSLLYGSSFESGHIESPVYSWNPVHSSDAAGDAALDGNVTSMNPAAPAPALKVTMTSSGSSGSGNLSFVGWSNRGIGNEGLAWQAGQEYEGYALVLAPDGATLYFGAHDRTAGVVDASASVIVPPSSSWQRVNFTFVPAGDATCTGIVNGSDPTISCGTNADPNGSGPPTNPGQVCVRCDGEFVVGLAAPGTAWIGFVDFRPGAWGTFGPAGSAKKDTFDLFASMGVSVIRQGGTVSQTFAWKEWRGQPYARAAMQHYWQDRLVPVTWGPFEFIDATAAAGIEPILTFAYDLNSAEDWADLVEYCWGNSSTVWGAIRSFNDSHPEPYAIRTFELGNEQDNPDFVAQVAAMEARAAAVGAPALRYIYPSNPGTLPNATAQGILDVGGPQLAARTMPDIHIWGSQGGVQAAQSLAQVLPNYPSSFVNLEINARTSNLGRGINEAADLQQWFNVGHPFVDRLLARTTSFCTERSGHYDGYDQGLVFWLPNMTFAQPPAVVHQMVTAALAKARNGLTVSVASSGGSSGSTSWLQASAQLSDDGSLLIVQLVNQNVAGAPAAVTLSLTPDFTPSGQVLVTALWDPAADAAAGILPNATAANTPAQPAYIAPATFALYWPRGSSTFTLNVPAFSFWVVEVYRG